MTTATWERWLSDPLTTKAIVNRIKAEKAEKEARSSQ